MVEKKVINYGLKHQARMKGAIAVRDVPGASFTLGIFTTLRSLQFYMRQKLVKRPFKIGRETFYYEDYIFPRLELLRKFAIKRWEDGHKDWVEKAKKEPWF